MTIQHIVLIRFADGASEDQVTHLAAGLSELPDLIPEIRAYRHGRDLGLRQTTWDYAVTGQYESAEAFQAYLVHPAHKALVAERLEPITAQRVSVQFDI